MYCMKCGAELEESTKLCPECGANQNVEISPKKNKNKAPLIIGAACVAVVVVIAALMFLLPAGGINASPEKVAAAFVENIYEYNAAEMAQCWPDFVIRERAVYVGLSPDATRREFAKALEAEAAKYENEKTNVDILSSRVVGDMDLYEMYEDSDYYGFNYEEFQQIKQAVYVEVVCKPEGEDYTDTYEVLCVQMENKWYMVDVD